MCCLSLPYSCLSNFSKIPYGGYWSLIIASIPLGIILIFVYGQKKLATALQPVPLDNFLKQFNEVYGSFNRISGTALFFARDFRRLPQYIPRIMFTNNIIYDDNIIVSIIRTEQPFGVTWGVTREIAKGLSIFEIYLGYMEIVDIGAILKEAEIEEKTIFYGMEEIITTHPVWRIFAAIKRLTPSMVQFYKLPSDRIHGVVTGLNYRPFFWQNLPGISKKAFWRRFNAASGARPPEQRRQVPDHFFDLFF